MERLKLITLQTVILLLTVVGCTDHTIIEEPFIPVGDGEIGEKENNPYWDWADKYPGPVLQDLERVNDVSVLVKGGYIPFSFNSQTPALQSSGLYAAQNDIITIDVPQGITTLNYQIGMGHTLHPKQVRWRYESVVSSGRLKPGKNAVSSYFGGFVYLYYDNTDIPSSDTQVSVSGAVQSNAYILGVTDNKEWLNTMKAQSALMMSGVTNEEMVFLKWTELRSDKVILTCGVRELDAMANPQTVLEYYGKVADAYYAYNGSDPAGRMPLRVYTDTQLPDENQTPQSSATKTFKYGAYPIGFIRGESPSQIVDERRIIDIELLKGQKSTEYGTWYAVLNAFCDLFMESWQTSKILSQPSLITGYYHYCRTMNLWPAKFINFSNNVITLNKNISNLVGSDKYPMYASKDADFRSTLFMQLSAHLGWGVFPYISQRSRELGLKSSVDQNNNDFFVMSVCEYANKNLLPFFRKWYFPFTAYAAEYCNQFPTLTEEFWTQFDNNYVPSFDRLTPNKDIERGPMPGDVNWYNTTGKNWTCTSEVVNPRTGKLVRTTNDNNAVDGSVFTFATVGDQMVVGNNPKDSLSQRCTTIIEFGGEKITFNSLSYFHGDPNWKANQIYDIEYYDDVASEWKSTVPSKIRLLVDESFQSYYWEQTYTSTKLRFIIQPRLEDLRPSRLMRVKELMLGLYAAEPTVDPVRR